LGFYSYIKKHERTFKGAKNIRWFYIPPVTESEHLIITFSGFHGRETQGVDGAYNYVKPISKIDCHRLFILDSYDGTPCYYIGGNKTNDYESSVASLIFKVIGDLGLSMKNVITCGSSKGGTAGIYFALKYNLGHACVGGFQVKVGTYLNSVSTYTRENVLKCITGGSDRESVQYLDEYYLEFFNDVSVNTNINMHAGNQDPHYLNHMTHFTNIMDDRNIKYNLNLADYDSHKYIGDFYTRYLLDILPEITRTAPIKELKTEYSNNKINIDIKLPEYLISKTDIYYAYSVFESGRKLPIMKVPYSKNDRFTYKVVEPGNYKVEVSVKHKNKIYTEESEQIKVV